MAKGQHEEMLESLARIEEILKKPPQPIVIEVKCCEETKEILTVVQNIQTQTKEITMSLKDVEAKIDEVGTAVSDGLAGLNTTLQAEVQQIIEAIRAGGDTSVAMNKLIALKDNVNAGFTKLGEDISNIVTPPTPPVEPPSAKKK